MRMIGKTTSSYILAYSLSALMLISIIRNYLAYTSHNVELDRGTIILFFVYTVFITIYLKSIKVVFDENKITIFGILGKRSISYADISSVELILGRDKYIEIIIKDSKNPITLARELYDLERIFNVFIKYLGQYYGAERVFLHEDRYLISITPHPDWKNLVYAKRFYERTNFHYGRPMFQLYIILPLILMGCFLITFLLNNVYTSYHHISAKEVSDSKGILILFPSFIWWIVASLVLSNFIMHSIPYFRKIQQDYGNGEAEYAEAMSGLLPALVGASVLLLPLAFLGFFLPV